MGRVGDGVGGRCVCCLQTIRTFLFYDLLLKSELDLFSIYSVEEFSGGIFWVIDRYVTVVLFSFIFLSCMLYTCTVRVFQAYSHMGQKPALKPVFPNCT